MSDAPPPYPGINQNSPNYPPPSYNQTPYAAQSGAGGYPPQNPQPQQPYGFNNNPTGYSAPYSGNGPSYPNAGPSYPNSGPSNPSYPTLPPQGFGFNSPSAPGQPSKIIFLKLLIYLASFYKK